MDSKVTHRHLVEGKEIVVVDDAFPPAAIKEVTWLTHNVPFYRCQKDTHRTKQRSMFVPFELERAQRMLFMPTLLDLVRELFPTEQLEPYQATMHNNAYGDMSHPHKDRDDPGVTVLVYANAEWDIEWGGETLFYDSTGDAVVCVTPRPGRIVLFRANIMHRNGVPSRECYVERFAIALKLRAPR